MVYKIQFLKVLSLKDLRSYIQNIFSWKILSVHEERLLSEQVYYNSDIIAARTIVLSNLRFVVHISRNYLGYGLPQADLIQEGNIGLMKAVRRFNPNINVRIISFAIYWIKSEMHEYILKNWRIVKVATTKSQRKLFFNLRKTKKTLGWLSDCELKTVAKKLGVKKNDVQEMETRLLTKDVTLYPVITNQQNDFNNSKKMIPYLKDYKSNFAKKYEKEDWGKYHMNKLNYAMLNLDARSRYIIYARWFNHQNKITLQEIAKNYGISAERVRQLEKYAIQKLKYSIQH
ncbi:RNA polymerase sigma factor RpoH [Buchnera aphidicola]|uniref:RNA polymerase sigma factor RpoH n=1 Tax=Buchnera aphidicola TaxID=9 RepID=UPI003463E7BA